ncbi:MAG: methyltransferase [Bacteroidales bacterium]|jgi:tRNA1Val (adenine37-N6)-methyltransferase|nr:methyltransferase [Bacteroidales bacterium]MDD4603993.1 methyltransferase [Bacteroidales bacterium]
MAFRFKQFNIEDTHSTLRVGTDAMLLGAWACPDTSLKILDIGTGCGILAIMMAQQSEGYIEAIDVDLPSVCEAVSNFSKCPWSKRLTAIHSSLQEFSTQIEYQFEFIITNPPYFSNSLKSRSERKNKTRHDDGLTIEELVTFVDILLTQDGRFTLILPPEPAKKCCFLCEKTALHLKRRMMIYPKPGKPPVRILMEFSKSVVSNLMESELTILDSTGKFSDAYFALTSKFHRF